MPTYIKDSILQAVTRLKNLHTRQNNSGGSTGFDSLDTVLSGVHTGDLIVLAGFTDNYKTTLALQILIHNLLVENKSIIFSSPVLSSLQITNRLIALTSTIPLDKISGGMLEDHEWKGLTETVGMLESSKLIISDNAEWTETKGNSIKNLRDIIARDRIKLVFIDPMQINEKEDYISALKELARDLGVIIFIVIDIPHPAIKESIPSYSDLEQFGNIGDYADALCFVYKENMLDPLEMGDEKVETIVLTNYACRCRLFVDESTSMLLEKKDYKSRQIDLVKKT